MKPESTQHIHALSTDNYEKLARKFFFQKILLLNQVISAIWYNVDQSSSYLTSLKDNPDLDFFRNKLECALANPPLLLFIKKIFICRALILLL